MPGGFGGGGARRPADPNALPTFFELNNDYNAMVSMMQIGLDMAPTPTQIATWESECPKYNRTVTAWKDLQKQIADFNAVLAKNNLEQLTVPSTKLTDSPCSFGPTRTATTTHASKAAAPATK
jgi:hypothetical protein